MQYSKFYDFSNSPTTCSVTYTVRSKTLSTFDFSHAWINIKNEELAVVNMIRNVLNQIDHRLNIILINICHHIKT